MMPKNLFLGLMALVILSSYTYAQEDLSSVERRVKHFNFQSGFAATMSFNQFQEFMELSDTQMNEMTQIKASIKAIAKEIQEDPSLDPNQKLEKLNALKKKQNEDLKDVLLPHQKTRLESLPIFTAISQDGFGNTVVNGIIAQILEFNDAERRKIREGAMEAMQQYQKDMDAAQKKAIEKIRNSIPKDKLGKYNEFTKPLISSSGTIWKSDGWMFNPDRALFSQTSLPSIKDEKPKSDK
jgi:hypothetical protein